MARTAIDTNVIVRFLIETPETIEDKFRGVFSFFPRVEEGTVEVYLPELVLFQSYFVLTSYYGVPGAEAAEKLEGILSFRGVHMPDKGVAADCMGILRQHRLDLVDAYILAYSRRRRLGAVYSFDADLARHGLGLLNVS